MPCFFHSWREMDETSADRRGLGLGREQYVGKPPVERDGHSPCVASGFAGLLDGQLSGLAQHRCGIHVWATRKRLNEEELDGGGGRVAAPVAVIGGRGPSGMVRSVMRWPSWYSGKGDRQGRW